jgi:hypothetical protein
MTPAALALAVYARPFAALRGQDIGVSGIGVAPAQVILELAGQHGVVGVVGVAQHEASQWAELALDRVGQEALVGVRHSSILLRVAQWRMAGVVLADRLSKIT